MKSAIVIDVDGVILNSAFIFDEIFKLGLKGDAMWDYFHEHCNSERVKLISDFKPLYNLLKGLNINLILLTSRNDKVKLETAQKLRSEGILFDKLYMRKNGDYREANIIKKETLQNLQKEYNILMFIDDDLNNCEAAKELGIFSLRKV